MSWRCRYCKQVVTPKVGEWLPRDRCPGKRGSAKAWHLWKRVITVRG